MLLWSTGPNMNCTIWCGVTLGLICLGCLAGLFSGFIECLLPAIFAGVWCLTMFRMDGVRRQAASRIDDIIRGR